MNKKFTLALLVLCSLSTTVSNSAEKQDEFKVLEMKNNYNFPNKNPMGNIKDSAKYGEIIQVNAHDALAKNGYMTRLKGHYLNLFGYGTNNLDPTAACQYYSPDELANLGVTCFDIRVYNNTKSATKPWRGQHGGVTSELDALEEVANLIKHINKNKETVYTIKFRGKEGFLYALADKLKTDNIDFENLVFAPANTKKNYINNITLGEIRETKKNLIIIDSEKEKPTERYQGVWKNKIWRNVFATAFSDEQQLKETGKELVDLGIKKLKEIKQKEPNLTRGMTPAPTLGLKGVCKGTSYLVPLNGAKDLNQEIVESTYNELSKEENLGLVQHIGLNGITATEHTATKAYDSPLVTTLLRLNNQLRSTEIISKSDLTDDGCIDLDKLK